MYELTGRLVLIDDSKAIIHLPRRNYGYTKFIYTSLEIDETQIAKFEACENLCFFSGNFSFSGNQDKQFGSEYQINSKLVDFKMGGVLLIGSVFGSILGIWIFMYIMNNYGIELIADFIASNVGEEGDIGYIIVNALFVGLGRVFEGIRIIFLMTLFMDLEDEN